jgi:hypothetical protein
MNEKRTMNDEKFRGIFEGRIKNRSVAGEGFLYIKQRIC